MQIKLDFSISKHESFRDFVETKKTEGYNARKTNMTACATILEKGDYRISICPSHKGGLIASEYELSGPQTPTEIKAHRHPDDFREPRQFRQWKLIRSYDLLLVG